MIQNPSLNTHKTTKQAFVVIVTLVLSMIAGYQVSLLGVEGLTPFIAAGLGIMLVYHIFQRPYLGLVIITATLPVDQILPDIPYFSSLFPVIGGLTILAYLVQRRREGLSVWPDKWQLTYMFALAFIIWMFVSNPTAAYQRNRSVAIFTYIQLFSLVLLTVELFKGHRSRYHVLMWAYVVTCLYSAHVAIQDAAITQADVVFDTGGGSGGLNGINASARHYTIAFFLLFYLRGNLKGMQRWMVILTWAAQLYLMQGVIVTGSRTAIIIAVIGIVLLLLSPTSKIKPQRVLVPAIVATLVYVAVPGEVWDGIFNSIFPSLEEGTDTVATRYELWDTAMRMVADKPLTGVGIDQFIRNVRAYSDPLSATVKVTGAHSTYFAVLAETGYPGFIMFMGIIGSSIYYALQAAFRLRREEDKNLAYIWFVALVVLLVGGLTKHDHYDKLLWLMYGTCTAVTYFLIDQQKKDDRALEASRAA
jgi:O-antigen ligase